MSWHGANALGARYVPVMTDLPGDLQRELDGVVAAHARLGVVVDGLTDDQARQPSRLPGWTVGHVLTHIARNADGLRRMIEGARRGEQAMQYPGGMAQRNEEIDAGADRPAGALVEDVRATSSAFEAAATELNADHWANGSGLAAFGVVSASEIPFRRRREVVVHRSDLGLDGADDWLDWPSDFVTAELRRMTMQFARTHPMGVATLPPAARAAPPAQQLAWLFGRIDIPGLDPANVM